MNLKRNNFTIIAILLFVLLIPSLGNAAENWDEAAAKRKANYIYLEAAIQKATEKSSIYQDLISYTYRLDPSNLEVGHEKGILDMVTAFDSSQVEKGYKLMEKYFNSNPQSLEANFLFGSATEKLRSPDETIKVWETIHSRFPNETDAKIQYAVALSMGDSAQMRKAIEQYNEVEKITGITQPLSKHKAIIYSKLNDTINIIAETDKLLQSDPQNASNINLIGNIYLVLLNDSVKALDYFDKAFSIDPTSAEVITSRLAYFIDQDDGTPLFNELAHVVDNEDVDFNLKTKIIGQFYSKAISDNDSTAIPLFEILYSQLPITHPNEPNAYLAYAAYFVSQKDYKNAAIQLHEGLEIDPDNAELMYQLINACAFSNNKSVVDYAVNMATQKYPDNTSLNFISGVAYSVVNEPDSAIKYLRLVVDSPDSPNPSLTASAYTSLGDTYASIEQYDSAYYYYEKAIELTPDNINTINNYAYFLAINKSDLDKAEAMSRYVIENEPENATYIDTYAWIKFLQIDYIAAHYWIDKALAAGGYNTSEILHHAGDIYFMCGNLEEAIRFWNAALELEPENELLKKKIKHQTFFYK